MATFYDALDDDLIAFVEAQQMFFTATAAPDARINLSPKGTDTLRVFDERTVGYLDLTGSGNETAAHIAHDGRLTIMLCSFGPRARILRLYGHGEVVLPGQLGWQQRRPAFGAPRPGERQIILLHLESAQTSCGYAVPRYTFESHRDTLDKWAEHKGADGLIAYRKDNNRRSIDGLSAPYAEE